MIGEAVLGILVIFGQLMGGMYCEVSKYTPIEYDYQYNNNKLTMGEKVYLLKYICTYKSGILVHAKINKPEGFIEYSSDDFEIDKKILEFYSIDKKLIFGKKSSNNHFSFKNFNFICLKDGLYFFNDNTNVYVFKFY